MNRWKQRLARVPGIRRLRERYYARFGVKEYFCPAIAARLRLNRALHGSFLRDPHPEAHVLEAMRALVGPGAVVLDIGASIGFHTVFLGKLVSPSGRVFAVEPSAQSMSFLRANAAANGLSWVVPIEEAIAEKSGTAALLVRTDHAGRPTADTRNSLLAAGGTGSVEIPIRTLSVDDLAARHELTRLDLVKIDVEGLELPVLAGGAATFSRLRPAIIVEVNDVKAAVECTSWLAEHRYSVRALGTAAHGTHLLARPAT